MLERQETSSKEMDETIELRLRADVKPEREQLYFHYDPSQVPDRMGEVMGSIKTLAEEMLYHWKTFPIELPPSITERDSLGLANGGGGDNQASARHKVSFKDLFIAPTFDELEEVALDKNGGQKRLQERQLNSIWRNGEFDVDSIHFPGQMHRWRLTQLLQKGSERAHATLLDDAALALQLMIITARNRFVSGFFSVSQSLKGWGRGLWKLMDIVIGMPSKTPGDLSAKVREEHMHYLVAELDIKTSSKRELNNFCEYVKEQSRLLRTEKHKTTDLRPPPIPYRYQSPKGQDVDLRLFNKDLINNCLPILSNILTREAKGWHIHYRQRLLRELRGKGLSLDELSERLNDAVMEEYLRRVFASVLNNAELESLQPGIGTLLVAQAQAVLAMKQAVQNLQFKMQMHKEQLVSHLKKQYPVKSRIQAWMDEQLQAFEEEFITQNLWSAHEEAISLCEEQNLHQAVYFLRRDLNFIKEREAILKKELSKVKDPTRVFIFHTRIWFPRNWVIWKMHHGNIDVIPTVIKQKPPLSGSKKEASYTLEKTISRTTSTRYPFWRWWNYLHRTWSWLWNAMFFFGVVVPWCSPVGLRALLGPEPFMPDLVLSQATGVLYPDESSLTHTLSSRLHRLWNHVHHSIHKFEDTPDTGFLGKDVTRFLNRLWNYVFKGAFGSVCLVVTFPVIALVVSSLSMAVAITAPLWVPAFTLLAHLGFILFYDVDCPDERGNRVLVILEALVWNLLMQGCLQPVSACLVGAVCCPIASLSILAFGLLRRGGRGLWDTLMFHTIIKGRGRVPAGDGFVARRIAGPGLASNYFFQIRPEQALAAVEASIERDELEAWRQNVLQVIDLPRDDYRKFVEKCFRPFSAGLIDEGVYKQLCMETAQYATDLRMKVEERERNLYLGLTSDLQRKIKLPERDLKLTILHTAQILQQFYPERYIQRLSLPEAQFWENQQLLYRDWRGLACLKLTQIFSKAFLIPLEETDKCFELKVEHINLSRYAEMLVSADFHDDLDVVLESHSPAGDINAKPPHLDVGYFNPSQRMIHTTRFGTPRDKKFPWTRSYRHKVFDKLEIPLPIPHPAYVAISIYNRENDRDEIDLTDPLCQRMVRASQEVPYVDLSDLASLDLYDPEVSTPDNATAESLTVVSHLAQQERTFSEDDEDDDDELAKSTLVESPFPESATSPTPNSETYSDLGSAELGKLVYAEPEKDTSCMVFVDDDNIGAGITDYDINQDP